MRDVAKSYTLAKDLRDFIALVRQQIFAWFLTAYSPVWCLTSSCLYLFNLETLQISLATVTNPTRTLCLKCIHISLLLLNWLILHGSSKDHHSYLSPTMGVSSFYYFFLETESPCVAQAILEPVLLLPQLPKRLTFNLTTSYTATTALPTLSKSTSCSAFGILRWGNL